jgi:hypothetical protein
MVPVLELQLETFALAPLTAGVVKTIEPLAAKNDNQVVVKGDGAITLHADQMRLRQASLNLMSNADKFTKKRTLTIATHQGLGLVLPCWVQRNALRPGRQSGLRAQGGPKPCARIACIRCGSYARPMSAAGQS